MAKRRTKSQKKVVKHNYTFSTDIITGTNTHRQKKVTKKKALGESTSSLLDYAVIKKDITKTLILSVIIIFAQYLLFLNWS